MVCCFMNLHEKENAQNLSSHFDKEIEIAVGRGCYTFVCGNKYPEDEIFAQRVKEAAKNYAEDEIKLLVIAEPQDEKLMELFIKIAQWEIYSYEV